MHLKADSYPIVTYPVIPVHVQGIPWGSLAPRAKKNSKPDEETFISAWHGHLRRKDDQEV